jgi:hypothetical protein
MTKHRERAPSRTLKERLSSKEIGKRVCVCVFFMFFIFLSFTLSGCSSACLYVFLFLFLLFYAVLNLQVLIWIITCYHHSVMSYYSYLFSALLCCSGCVCTDFGYAGEANVSGEPHGRGMEVGSDGSVYKGVFVNGKYEGKGVKHYCSGNIYEGYWSDNNFEGEGTYTWKDGSVCTGLRKGGEMNGKGVKIFADGYRYEGVWADDSAHGEGVLTDSKGRVVFNGEWKNGFKCAPFVYMSCCIFVSLFAGLGYEGSVNQMGEANGKGVGVWIYGDCYEGDWVNGKMEGEGKMVYGDGKTYTGQWTGSMEDGEGVLKDMNGMVLFSGLWRKGFDVRCSL